MDTELEQMTDRALRAEARLRKSQVQCHQWQALCNRAMLGRDWHRDRCREAEAALAAERSAHVEDESTRCLFCRGVTS